MHFLKFFYQTPKNGIIEIDKEKSMQNKELKDIELATQAAIEVLLHNAHGPFHGLPRTAGWGYPEPYTRDLMFSILGIAVSGNQKLLDSIRKVLETLAKTLALIACIRFAGSFCKQIKK